MYTIDQLEQVPNHHLGAATKALLLTWLQVAEEIRIGESPMKLEAGVLNLLKAQEAGKDTELEIHGIGYLDEPNAMTHDRDVAATFAEERALEATHMLAGVVAQLLAALPK